MLRSIIKNTVAFHPGINLEGVIQLADGILTRRQARIMLWKMTAEGQLQQSLAGAKAGYTVGKQPLTSHYKGQHLHPKAQPPDGEEQNNMLTMKDFVDEAKYAPYLPAGITEKERLNEEL